MKTIQEITIIEKYWNQSFSVKNVGYIHRKANIIDVSMILIGLDQTAKY